MQTPKNPLEGYLSACCGAEHDINAEHNIDNEIITGGCSRCFHYTEFLPSEEFARRSRDWVKIS